MGHHTRAVCALVLAAWAVAAFSVRPLAAADGNYHLLKKVVLGGEGSWDYLICDSAARRVYISRGTHVMVVDADTYAVVGDIPGTDGVHGIALAPEFGRGFTSNGRANTVTIFDLKTLKILGTAPTGERSRRHCVRPRLQARLHLQRSWRRRDGHRCGLGKARGNGRSGRQAGVRRRRRARAHLQQPGRQERTRSDRFRRSSRSPPAGRSRRAKNPRGWRWTGNIAGSSWAAITG